MRRTLLRCALTLALAGAIGVAVASPASAGPPRRQACIGTGFRALATDQPAPGAFGHGVGSFAKAPNTAHPGLGDGIQALQAGLVPDDLVENTCND